MQLYNKARHTVPLLAAIPLFPLLIALIVLGIFSATRIGLGLYAGFDLVEPSLWPGIIIKGLYFDLAVVAVLVAFICLYEAVLPRRRSGWNFLRALILLPWTICYTRTKSLAISASPIRCPGFCHP